MKKQQKLQDAIGLIGDDLILEAKAQRKKAARLLRRWYIPTVATAAIVAIVVGGFFFKMPPKEEDFGVLPPLDISGDPPEDAPPDLDGMEPTEPGAPAPDENQGPPSTGSQKPGTSNLKVQNLAMAVYPEATPYPTSFDQEAYSRWNNARSIRSFQASKAGNVHSFVGATMKEFLKGKENAVYSPLNLYVSLAMLAELAEEESQQQILELVGMESVEKLRVKVSNLWQAHYRDDGALTSVLANSIWLDQKESYMQETLDLLAEEYYVSAYEGTPGTEEFDQGIRDWINEQTGGLLDQQVNELESEPGLIFSLISAVYYQGKWSVQFKEENTKDGVFHGTNGDKTCSFMNATIHEKNYYYGDQFTAVFHEIDTGGGMWLILPDEGVEMNSLLADPQVQALIQGQKTENMQVKTVHLSMPKFDVCQNTELEENLKKLGVTGIFEKTELTKICESSGLMVYDATHAARVTVDEEGCTATAFTNFDASKGIPAPGDEVAFTLDRPFLFAVTSEYHVPLFMGTVQNP